MHFKVGDKIRGKDALGIVDGQPGIVRGVHTRYPTQEDYEDLTNPSTIYEVQFLKGKYLLQDYQMEMFGKQQQFSFMYDFPEINKLINDDEI